VVVDVSGRQIRQPAGQGRFVNAELLGDDLMNAF